MALAGQVAFFLCCLSVQFGLTVTASYSSIQCLAGLEKNTTFNIKCFNESAPYINITNVILGAVTIKSSCDVNSTYSTCCNEIGACSHQIATLLYEMRALCSGETFCKRDTSTEANWLMDQVACNGRVYSAYATYLKVEYDCLADKPLITTAKPTAAPQTSTAIYSNNLTMGEQAAIICCIMLFIVLIGAAVVIYKRIKYGPPEDTRKLFSRPHVEGTDSPGVTPWIAGEAQEQVYNTVIENQKKKKKRKFPKFKF